MEILLQQIINGLVLGSMYALIALGYTMVYGIIQLINFAHGEVLMIGALTSWSCIGLMQGAMPGAPGWVILLLGHAHRLCGGRQPELHIEKVAYRPLRNSPRLAPLITAIGMSILLQTLAMIIWKPNYKPYPTMLPSTPFQVGGAFITPTQILILGVTAVAPGLAGLSGQPHQPGPRHARHGRKPPCGGAHGRQARHGDLGHLHHRCRSGRHRRHDVRVQLRHGAAHHGLPARPEGLHGSRVWRHRQPGRCGGGRHPCWA
jgi:hypothetical protein